MRFPAERQPERDLSLGDVRVLDYLFALIRKLSAVMKDEDMVSLKQND